MTTAQISARIDARLKKALDDFCRSRGIVMNDFIREALVDRLDEMDQSLPTLRDRVVDYSR